MNKYFILFLLNIVLLKTGSTQNPPLVEYDLRTGTLNKPFPFDQSFVIRLMHIPPTWNIVKIEIREVRNLRKHVKNLSTSSSGITNEELNKKLNPRFVYDFERKRDFRGDTLEFLQLGWFSHNTDYVLNISGLRGLNQAEKNALSTYIEGSPIINDLVRKLTKKALSEEDMTTIDDLTEYVRSLNDAFSKAIQGYDPNYRFKNLTETELRSTNADNLSKIANFSTTMFNLKKDLDKFYQEAQKKNGTIKIQHLNTIDLTNYQEGLDRLLKQLEEDANTAGINWANENFKDKFDDFKTALEEIQDITEQIVSQVVEQRASFAATIGTTYFSGAAENARTYLSFDAGYGTNMALQKWFPYLGINIYFRPIKREIPLKHYKGRDIICSRVSALVGLTANSIESEPKSKGLIGNKAILLGGGVRVLPWLKFNYARMIYYNIPDNPLVNRRYLASDHFISASIDIDIVETFKTIFK